MHLCPSPNYEDRPFGAPINILVLHYTGMQSAEAALKRLCDQEAKVSAHYLIDEAGNVYQLVAEDKRAWHAGISYWRGREQLNDVSIGIELVNPGHEFGYRPFPHMQMQSLLALSQEILKRHPIPAENIVAHSDIAPDRKQDPGELFNWRLLAKHGIGLWPEDGRGENIPLLAQGDEGPNVHLLQRRLHAYGYRTPVTGTFDQQTAHVVQAFKRHFCPTMLNQRWDTAAERALISLFQQRGMDGTV